VAVAVGDPWRARAAADEYLLALEARDHAGWAAAAAAGAARSGPILRAGADALGAFARLVLALGEGRPEAADELAVLRAADPAFDLDRAPYARRVPWTGAGRQALREWIDALDPTPTEAADDGDPLAEIEAAARGRRAGLGPPVPDTAETAAAPLLARAAEALERQAFWPDPLTEHHWTALRADLRAARTSAEVELIAFHAAACLAVEGDWNLLLLGGLLAPLRAALEHDLEPGPERAAAARRAARSTRALTGLGPRALLDHPRVAFHVERVVIPLAARDPGPLGADEGEAGFDLVTVARGWQALSGAVPDAAGLTGALDRARVPEPPSAPLPVRLWDTEVGAADLLAAARKGARLPL
jgi:hypothetical protein